MCKGIVGKKLGMTSVYAPNGKYIPVTVLKVGPCVVTQIKKDKTDGYSALQLGFGAKKEAKTTKPLKGHFDKSGGACFSTLKEVGVRIRTIIRWDRPSGPRSLPLEKKSMSPESPKGADLQALLNAMGSTVDGRPTAAIATGGPDLSGAAPGRQK
jgi:hypothetical protein